MESVRLLGRLRVRRRFCWKARNSCLRFAWSSAEGVARMVLALERRLVSTLLGSFITWGGEDEAADSEAEWDSDAGGDSEDEGESAFLAADFRLLTRPARLSVWALGAPVA